MSKHRGRSRNRNSNQGPISPDTEIDAIREQQKIQHQIAQNRSKQYRGPLSKMQIVVLLENGASFAGTAVIFNYPNSPGCKLFFKTGGKQELGIVPVPDINLQTPSPEKISVLVSSLNNYLIALHEEAVLEFPAWMEKYSTRTNEKNPYFNLDEIREEFNYKKSRFGIWRKAAQAGFFDSIRPVNAKFNKIVRLELRELEPERCL